MSETKQIEVFIDIAPILRGHITPRDLINANATIIFNTNYSEICSREAGYIFRLLSKGYTLEMGFSSTLVYLQRNNQRLEYPIIPVYKPFGNVQCFASWSPHELSLLLLDETYRDFISTTTDSTMQIREIGRRQVKLVTPATIPPYSLINWARKESIAPLHTYENYEQFYEIITSSILAVQEKISTIGLHHPFWDINYDGLKIISRKPKRETDIQYIIHSLLYDIALAKNFQIIPEYQIAGGNLDFLVSGTLRTGENISVCIEFKSAHSNDLYRGLITQLPTYMRAKGCNYGLYCVLYFKGPDFLLPTEEKLELELTLYKRLLEYGLQNIRSIVLDLSKPTPPSKL
jgi:hypothetical protein